MNTKAIITGAAAIAAIGAGALVLKPTVPVDEQANVTTTATTTATTTKVPTCDNSLWQHVYIGDLRRFKTPQERLKVIEPCVTVTGILVDKKSESDGDTHIQMAVDEQFKNLLNAKNISEQKGYLVVEPTCTSIPTQKDTVAEGACNNWHNPLVIPPMGTRVSVTGVLIEDMEHHWIEEHPVSSIAILK